MKAEITSHGKQDETTIVMNKTNGIGGGIYDRQTDQKYTVNPGACHMHKTINRAELAPIYAALKELVPAVSNKNIVVFADSLTSLLQIRKQCLAPHKYIYHKHKRILRSIAQEIDNLIDKGYNIKLCKVKAHSNILGNEEADKAANEARSNPDNCDITVDIGGHDTP